MKFEVYKDKTDPTKEWRWRLISENGVDSIAVSGEGYKNLSDCLHGIALVKSSDTSYAAVQNLVANTTVVVMPVKMDWKPFPPAAPDKQSTG